MVFNCMYIKCNNDQIQDYLTKTCNINLISIRFTLKNVKETYCQVFMAA
jgi:hypothetical protein